MILLNFLTIFNIITIYRSMNKIIPVFYCAMKLLYQIGGLAKCNNTNFYHIYSYQVFMLEIDLYTDTHGSRGVPI